MQVCEIITGVLMDKNSTHQVVAIPLADGGEGTCEILTRISQGKLVSTTVLDPLMRPIHSKFGLSSNGKTAFIEMALASGLQLLKPEERNCLVTSTFGTGQLIISAISHGAKEIIIGIGGSATNDAGMGMAQALGYRFFSKSRQELEGIGQNLIQIDRIDNSSVSQEVMNARYTILSDVLNPLYGTNGASFLFARQKGASQNDILALDKGLRSFAAVAMKSNFDLNFAGAGAAGGLGAGSKFFLNAKIKSGINFILDFIQLEEKIKNADMIISGEGKIDKQTLSGKVVKGVADLAKKHDKKLVLIAGICELNENELSELGAAQVITLVDRNTSESEAMQNPVKVLGQKAKKIALS